MNKIEIFVSILVLSTITFAACEFDKVTTMPKEISECYAKCPGVNISNRVLWIVSVSKMNECRHKCDLNNPQAP